MERKTFEDSLQNPLAWMKKDKEEVERLLGPETAAMAKALQPGQAPEVCFSLCEGDEVLAVYAYCNLHSLWKA